MPPKEIKRKFNWATATESQRDAWYARATPAQRDAFEAKNFSQEAEDVGESTSRRGKDKVGRARYGAELTAAQSAAYSANVAKRMTKRGEFDDLIDQMLNPKAPAQVTINVGQPSSSNVPPRKSMTEIMRERLVAASIMDRLGRKASGPVSIQNRTGWKPATIISVMHNGTYRDVAMEDWQAPNKRWRDSYRENVRRDWNAKRRHILPTGYTPSQLAYRGFDTRVKPLKRVSPHKRSYTRRKPKPDYSRSWGLDPPAKEVVQPLASHVHFADDDSDDSDDETTPFSVNFSPIQPLSSGKRRKSLDADFSNEK